MNISDRIIEENRHWIVVNKPAGLIVERNPWELSVESLLSEYLQNEKRNPYLGIVHRLDRVTSGVLLLAKKKSTLKRLNEQFRERKVKKIYLAIVSDPPPKSQGTLSHWLFKDQKNKKALIFNTEKANTYYCILDYQLVEEQEGRYLLIVEPTTGKFHQIRAQFAAVGCPIVGDEKYGSIQDYKPRAVALHAWKLSFTDPTDDQTITMQAPLPTDGPWKSFRMTVDDK